MSFTFQRYFLLTCLHKNNVKTMKCKKKGKQLKTDIEQIKRERNT